MKLKYEFIFQPLGERYMGVAVGEGSQEFSGMLQLDEVAYDIVSRMTADISRDDLIAQLLSIYDADPAELSHYLDEVIGYLRSEGVLE